MREGGDISARPVEFQAGMITATVRVYESRYGAAETTIGPCTISPAGQRRGCRRPLRRRSRRSRGPSSSVAVDRHQQEMALAGPRLRCAPPRSRRARPARSCCRRRSRNSRSRSSVECWKLCSWPLKHARTPPRLEQLRRAAHAVGVAVLRAGAERRMMAERNAPAHAARRRGRKRPLHELPVLRIFEQPAAPEEFLLRRVEADELDVGRRRGTGRTARDRPRRGRRPPLRRAARAGRSCPSPARDRRAPRSRRVSWLPIDGHTRHPVEHVAIGLEVGEEPVVVFVAGVAPSTGRKRFDA